MQVDHLHGGKLLQHAARRQRVQASRQRDVQAIGQEGDEDVHLTDAISPPPVAPLAQVSRSHANSADRVRGISLHCDYRKAPSQSGRGGYYLRGFLRQTIVGEFKAVQPRKPTNPHQGMLPCRGGRPG
jgi:hypothetical protein